jgi:hypothetical protein
MCNRQYYYSTPPLKACNEVRYRLQAVVLVLVGTGSLAVLLERASGHCLI